VRGKHVLLSLLANFKDKKKLRKNGFLATNSYKKEFIYLLFHIECHQLRSVDSPDVKENTLRELINAELIFADEGSKKAYFAELIFANLMP